MRIMLKNSLAAALLALALVGPPAHSQATNLSPAPAAEQRLFAVVITTGRSWDQSKLPNEQAHFREHSAYLRKLRGAGHIVLGARYSDKGLLIFQAPTAAEVKALMDGDPSIIAATFAYEVHEFNVFYPGEIKARSARQ